MDKFLIRKDSKKKDEESSSSKRSRMVVNLDDVISDPGMRKSIIEFDVNIRDQIRREYLLRGPCRPIGHNYPRRQCGRDKRCFQTSWFDKYTWLEYSISKDAAFCFWCYLFKVSGGRGGDEIFTKFGMTNWRKAIEIFNTHVGGVDSAHNDAMVQVQSFQNQRQSIQHLVLAHSSESEVAYRSRLTAALDVTRYLLKQGLAFRGHDESCDSLNKGNYLELLEWYTRRNKDIAKTMNENAPANSQMTSPKVQKELTSACANEVTKVILDDIGDKVFSLMIDESRDVSIKEQMGVVLRYVNDQGGIIERFLAVVHVPNTSAISLKSAIDCLFAKHNLSISKLRGQGYDGASNMRGEYNGLKALILRENSAARYVHCFAHQLQLVVVSVAKSNRYVSEFFSYLGMIVNVTGVSCKRKELTMQFEHDRLLECLERGEIVTGRGKNQETSLKRPGDTRWGSHYITIVRLMTMWPSIVQVLENVHEDGECVDGSGLASSLIEKMESFDFVFAMYLMKHLLGITNQLSLALQQNDQNILLAVSLVQTMKEELQELRNEGWQKWLDQVSIFCNKYAISVPNMEENRVIRGRSKRSELMVTNLHHFRADIYIAVLDTMIREMNQRFPESSSELLKCIACLDPRDSFAKFDIGMLLKLASFYPDDFSVTDLGLLEHELQVYIKNVQADERFLAIENLGYLAKEMVTTGRDSIFPLTYCLIELALVLPVATASVERVFSAMKNIKTDLRNKMGDEWLNDSMVVYIEKQVFVGIENEKILHNYQKMQSRRMQLSPLNSASGPSVRK